MEASGWTESPYANRLPDVNDSADLMNWSALHPGFPTLQDYIGASRNWHLPAGLLKAILVLLTGPPGISNITSCRETGLPGITSLRVGNPSYFPLYIPTHIC